MNGDRSDASARAGHDDLAIGRLHFVLLEHEHAEHRCESGGAEAHRFFYGEAVGNLDDRTGAYTLLRRVAAPVHLTESVSVADDAIPDFELPARRLHDRAGEIDADDHRKLADDAAASGDGEAVFVVERRVGA